MDTNITHPECGFLEPRCLGVDVSYNIERMSRQREAMKWKPPGTADQ